MKLDSKLVEVLMLIAEQMFGSKTGPLKKALVIMAYNAAMRIIKDIQGVSTGGQKETWGEAGALVEKGMETFNSIIDEISPRG